jgi:hypothetical protein
MTLPRRLLLAAGLGAALPARADEARHDPPAIATPRPVRLRPGAAPVTLETALEDQRLVLRFAGEGAPAAVFRFPTWYGWARPFALLPLRGRELVLVAFEGNRGTGVYQEIQAAIGQDDDGVARLLALETLRARQTPFCGEESRLTVRLTPWPDGTALRLDHFARGATNGCGRPGGARRWREEWATTLRWSGRGPFLVPPPLPGAAPGRRLVEASRAKAAAWLAAAPRTEVTPEDLDALGLMEVLRDA